jgi:hypothetical protein
LCFTIAQHATSELASLFIVDQRQGDTGKQVLLEFTVDCESFMDSASKYREWFNVVEKLDGCDVSLCNAFILSSRIDRNCRRQRDPKRLQLSSVVNDAQPAEKPVAVSNVVAPDAKQKLPELRSSFKMSSVP